MVGTLVQAVVGVILGFILLAMLIAAFGPAIYLGVLK
jgi:hypothetical protein